MPPEASRRRPADKGNRGAPAGSSASSRTFATRWTGAPAWPWPTWPAPTGPTWPWWRSCFPRLAGYAGWNTAGNTLGTALACAALVPDKPTPTTEGARLSFLLERLADDALFQADLRQEISAPLGGSFVRLEGARLEETRKKVQELLGERVVRLFEEHFKPTLFEGHRPHLTRVAVDLPWPRTFEVEVEARIEYQRRRGGA